MKRIPLTLIGAAAALLLLAAWAPEVLATVRSADSTPVAPEARVARALGLARELGHLAARLGELLVESLHMRA